MNSHVNKEQRLYTLLVITRGLLTFCIIFLIGSVFANWPAIYAELSYTPKNAPTPTTTATLPVVVTSATVKPQTRQIIESPHIVITKLGIDTPITWQVPAEKTLDYLNKGVAHLAGSATLGQAGNLFITGHSSDYVWRQNPYAATFALLPKLTSGDSILIKENGNTFEYKVAQTQVVSPDNVQVTQPTTSAVLTLMTCYPIGTTRDRYIVQAHLVSAPGDLTTNTQSTQNLPEIKFR